MEALVARNYEKPLETARTLATKTSIPPFTRMAMIFQACRISSEEFSEQKTTTSTTSAQEKSFIHQNQLILHHFKLIKQGIELGEIRFDRPAALAEIVLIVLSVKLGNTLVPASKEEIEETLQGLITLLEKGTDNPAGSLNFLTLNIR